MGPDVDQEERSMVSERLASKVELSPAAQAMTTQGMALDRLEKAVEVLGQRLTPISAKTDEADSATDADRDPRRGNSDLVSSLDTNNDRLHRTTSKVNRIIRNLEV